MPKFGFSVLILCYSAVCLAQIKLQNPSFEGIPRENSTPAKWQPCGYFSTPDMLPGAWGVALQAKDGKTFVYAPAVSKDAYQSRSLRDLSDKLFDGAPAMLVARLVDDSGMSEAALEEIRALLERRLKNADAQRDH